MLLTDGGDFGNLETEEMKASAIFAANTTLSAMERNCGMCRTNYNFFVIGVTRMKDAASKYIQISFVFCLSLHSADFSAEVFNVLLRVPFCIFYGFYDF